MAKWEPEWITVAEDLVRKVYQDSYEQPIESMNESLNLVCRLFLFLIFIAKCLLELRLCPGEI
jgi:hypothetical protein